MTSYAYSVENNPVKHIGGIAEAYVEAIKNKSGKLNADPLYQEFIAMGMGGTSAYTADKKLSKSVRMEVGANKAKWLNPIEWVETASNMIEAGPRYAEYKAQRQRGATPHEAMYAASDVTVNFKRGGNLARELNKVVPFFNASVQGLDKFKRWITAEDAPKSSRNQVVRGRVIGFITASAVLAAVTLLINSVSDDDKENYAQLSNYTKNNFWCIPLGGGEYFAIPKPRELAILSSLFETILERYVNENENAFDGFDEYALDTLLPSVVSNAVQMDAEGLLGNFGLFGVIAHVSANKDFLGRPIVSTGLERLEPKDQYTDRTSKIAYYIGQAFNWSPQKVDYAFQQLLGGFWKTQKALFPIGRENIDVTLGVQNTYIKDNQYLLNNMYDYAESFKKKRNSNPESMDAEIKYKWSYVMTSFYSNYAALAKTDSSKIQARATRQTVLNMVSEFNKYARSGYVNPIQGQLEVFCQKVGGTECFPATMPKSVKDDSGTLHMLNANQYVEFQTEYNNLYWLYVQYALDNEPTEATVRAAKHQAYKEATANMLSRMYIITDEYKGLETMHSAGISSQDNILFQAALDTASYDGSRTKEEVLEIIERMELSNEAKSYLYEQQNYSEYGNIYKYNTSSSLSDLVEEKLDEGVAEGSVKSGITSVYKPLIVDAYLSGQFAEYNELCTRLESLPIYNSKGEAYYNQELFDEWIETASSLRK